MIRRGCLLVLLALFSTLVAAEKTLTLGIFAYRPTSMMEHQYRMLGIYLSGALPDQRVELKFFDTAGMEAALAANQLDFVFTNPSHYVLLRHHNKLTGAIATRQASGNGKITTAALGGTIIVRADRDDITQLADLVGKRIATPGSKFLGAYLAQAYELQQAGIPFPEGMALIEVSCNDEVVEAVLFGDADVGFVRSGLVETLNREGTLSVDQLKFINLQKFPKFPFAVSTRLYPEWPFVALPHVPEDTVKRIARALLFITPDMPVAQSTGIAGFTIPADYEPVQQLARALRLPPYETPEFGAEDVWLRYRWLILGAFGAGALITLLSMRLLVGNRRLRKTEAALRELATTDALTGVANRRQFLALAEVELARVQRFAQPAALLMLDLDHFKRINDTYGHAAGDAVLVDFAATVHDALRQVDCVSRLGGEEFAVLLTGCTVEDARMFAERLRQLVAERKVSYDEQDIEVTVSIGIASMQRADVSPESVLERADAALYRAKAAGRNRVEVEG
ncbi:MAG: diguanylate cyclase [Gammaproteobacteria bacterium]|nr:diguanylate cyclase [Rhodocyclaceae bacterium]MBU3909842.1 diguanylate cyclase [Gammaproteobacteria bacterium]MBU3988092.1 diguanylate cyclase [Gammaproteobacteria bacterium]MBU4003579.1 diguanylate cyclase [Gammaproteobacteria bacterium]MBU4020062.1 diguanylate cyclase [Gammaproteobacteria bacterium]